MSALYEVNKPRPLGSTPTMRHVYGGTGDAVATAVNAVLTSGECHVLAISPVTAASWGGGLSPSFHATLIVQERLNPNGQNGGEE